MSHGTSQVKVENTAALGAKIVLVGEGSEERAARTRELVALHGYIPVPPADDRMIIAGQGTIGLEILEDLPDVDMVVAPVGGGGLISGIAIALKLSRPEIRVIGVEPEFAADAQASLRSGTVVRLSPVQTARTAADGVRAQQVGAIPFQHIQVFVDDIVTVSEEEIWEALRLLALRSRLIVEPSGAVAYAAYLFHRLELPTVHRTVIILSGGNVEAHVLAHALTTPGPM
jgi:threonine dehydratase